MPSIEAQRAIEVMRSEKGAPALPLAERRIDWLGRAMKEPLPEGTEIKTEVIGGVESEIVSVGEIQTEDIFLLLHGGGYHAGTPVTHRKLAAHISVATGRAVFVPDYRLAPEHPFPAALEDARAVYDALLMRGLSAEQISVGGDSAGGGLTAALLINLRDDGAAMPSSGVLLSPWTDILCRGESYEANAEIDPGMNGDGLREAGREYFGSSDPDHALISPIRADLSGLPPLLVHVGASEIMLDDSTVFVERSKSAGVDVHLEIWDDMWHVWHNTVPVVPEAIEAIRRIGEFVRAKR